MCRITTLLTTALLMTIGCAHTTPMALGTDHPAHAEAAAAPVPPRSTVLVPSAPPATVPARGAAETPHDARKEPRP